MNEEFRNLLAQGQGQGQRAEELWYEHLTVAQVIDGLIVRTDEKFGEFDRTVMSRGEAEGLRLRINLELNSALKILDTKVHFLRNEGGSPAILYYADNPELPEFGKMINVQRTPDFLASFDNKYIIASVETEVAVGEDGEDVRVRLNRKRLCGEWRNSPLRASYEGTTFVPVKLGTTEQDMPELYERFNLWRGLAVTPEKGDWGLIRSHIREIMANGDPDQYRWWIRYFAWLFQNLGEQSLVAPCMVGEQGAGKSIIFTAITAAFGTHGIRPRSQNMITGRFNNYLHTILFALIDEAMNPDSKGAVSIIKGMITDDLNTFEAKFRDPVAGRNRINMAIISNDEHFAAVENTDRRHPVFRVSSARLGDVEYFNDLKSQIENGGIEAMIFDLLAIDLGDWKPSMDIPETDERVKQKVLSYDGWEKAFHELLASGDGPLHIEGDKAVVRTSELVDYWKRTLGIAVTPHRIGQVMKTIGAVKAKRTGKGNGQINGYELPPLPVARAKWAEKQAALWNEDVDTWSGTEF